MTQKESTSEALPKRILLISVPVSTIPAVNVSTKKYSKEAFLFLICTGLFFLSSCSSLFIFQSLQNYQYAHRYNEQPLLRTFLRSQQTHHQSHQTQHIVQT